MKTELIFKCICQLLGIFPINVKGTTYKISKLYLASSYFVLLYLISVIVLFFARLQNNSNGRGPCGVLLKLSHSMFFMKVCASIVAVTSNIVYRHKNVKFYNKLMTFASWDQYAGRSTFKISGAINLVVMIAIGFLCLQQILTFASLTISTRENFDWYNVYTMFIEFPVFLDTIVICRMCTVMSNCHQQVKGQITNIYTMYCTEKSDSNGQRNTIKIISNSIIGPTMTQQKIIPDISKLVKKLEQLRHTNFELFQMHLYFLSSRQFQLFLLLIEILLQVIFRVYTFLSAITKKLGMSALCYYYMVVAILFKLISLFMLCYYNGKVFQEGQDTKYILQKIRPLSSERQFVISTNAFVSQLKRSKQYKICGLNTLDMSFPIKILEYIINYVLVLVQFFGFQE